MELKGVQNELRRLSSIIDEWALSGEIPAIERDLALDKLKQLYDTLRFADADTVKPTYTDDNSELDHNIEIELDDITIETVDTYPTPTSSVATEYKAEPVIAPEPEPEPVIVAAPPITGYKPTMPAKEYRAAESMPTVDPIDNEIDDDEIVDNVDVDEEALHIEEVPLDDTIEDYPAEDEISTADAESESELDNEDAATTEQPARMATISERVKQRGDGDAFSSLFDINDIPQVRRQRRSIIMSLYDDAPAKSHITDENSADDKPTAIGNASVSAIKEAVRPLEELAAESAPLDQATPQDAAVNNDTTDDNIAEFEQITHNDYPAATHAEPSQVLGETMNNNVKRIADAVTPPKDIASQIVERPLDNLRRGIGINDKFLMVRDLFEGDSHEFDTVIDQLNSFDNLDDCMIYIAENYAWSADSDGAKFIMQLLERRFSSK